MATIKFQTMTKYYEKKYFCTLELYCKSATCWGMPELGEKITPKELIKMNNFYIF